MTILLLCAAALAGAGFRATSPDGGAHIILSSTRPAGGVRCRWTVYRDAVPAASGNWPLAHLSAETAITNAAPRALAEFRARGGDVSLRVRFVTGELAPDKETLVAVSQIDLPRVKTPALVPYAGKPAELTATAGAYEFKTPSERIRFDRGTGLLSGFATGWWSLTEWLARPMAFDFGETAPTVRVEEFTAPAETNGVWRFKTISWWKTSTGRQGRRPDKVNFEIRVATDWQVRGDGRVVSQSRIRPFGLTRTLPRVGWAFVLKPEAPLVQYFGKGSPAGERDGAFAELDGLYSCPVAACGNHERTRAVAFDAGSDHLAFSTLGENFFLELGETKSKATYCGLVAARDTDTDRDFRLDLLISPEKTLQARSLPGLDEGSVSVKTLPQGSAGR